MGSKVIYRERLWPGFGLPSFLIFMGASLAIAYQRAYHGRVGLITLIISLAITGLVTIAMAPVVEVSASELRVGKARINRQYIGKTAVLDKMQTRHALGQGAHGSALTVTRAAIKTTVLVEILDEQDPHPYWQFSTRRPELLDAALRS